MSKKNNEEMQIAKDMFLRFLKQEVEPNYEQWEKDHILPRNFWNVLGDAGLLCIDLPEEYGAAAATFDIQLMVVEEMARLGYGGLTSSYNIHSNIIAPYIHHLGTQQQKNHWLPKLVSGESVAAIAMTEPGGGSDLAAMRTTAVSEGDEYIINGSKTFITNAIHADLVIVCAKTNASLGAKGVSLFLVDTRLPGFSRGKKIEKMGQHCSDTAELFFENLRVPANSLLGEEGRGFIYMMQELGRERLGGSMQSLGAAQGALDITIDYVQQRQAFGQTIDKFQNTRFILAQQKADLELCRAYAEKCIENYKLGQMTAEEAAIVKLTSSEMQCRVINECLQLFGGYGYTDEYPISRYYRDARIQTIYGGTSEIMKEIISRDLLGR